MAEDEFLEEDLNISGVWGESDFSLNNSLDDTFVSQPSSLATTPSKKQGQSSCESTPTKKKRDSEFKTPSAPIKIFAQCPECRSKLKTKDGFNTHMLRHRLRDLASKFGGKDDVIQHLRENVHSCLSKIKAKTLDTDLQGLTLTLLNDSVYEGGTENFNNFVEEVLKIIGYGFEKKGEAAIMAEGLRFQFQTSMSKCLCNKQLVEDLRSKLTLITPCTVKVFSLFLFDILWEFIDCSILFVCKTMKGHLPAGENTVSAKDDANHVMTHQLIYHVAGFAMYHHVSHAKKYPKNEKLQRMKECILTKFVQKESPQVLTSQDKAFWTNALNRKSLFFVNDKAFQFFLLLSKVLQSSVEKDGSVLHAVVLEKVVANSGMLAVWDGIIESVLDEDESFDLMIKTVKVVSRTFGRGNVLKKMNMLCQTTKDIKKNISISHRASLL